MSSFVLGIVALVLGILGLVVGFRGLLVTRDRKLHQLLKHMIDSGQCSLTELRRAGFAESTIQRAIAKGYIAPAKNRIGF